MYDIFHQCYCDAVQSSPTTDFPNTSLVGKSSFYICKRILYQIVSLPEANMHLLRVSCLRLSSFWAIALIRNDGRRRPVDVGQSHD